MYIRSVARINSVFYFFTQSSNYLVLHVMCGSKNFNSIYWVSFILPNQKAFSPIYNNHCVLVLIKCKQKYSNYFKLKDFRFLCTSELIIYSFFTGQLVYKGDVVNSIAVIQVGCFR